MWPFSDRLRVVKHGGASVFRQEQNKYLREFSQRLDVKRVANLGAKPDGADKEGRTYEDYFPSAEFITMDLGDDDHPRHRQFDLMEMPDDHVEFDLVLAMSLIEHIDRPWIAADTITNLIAPGGHLYIAMPFFYPVHEGPYFGDHWRATPSAMPFLFPRLKVVNTAIFKSALRVVRDRKLYWRDENSHYSGFAMLMRRPAAS